MEIIEVCGHAGGGKDYWAARQIEKDAERGIKSVRCGFADGVKDYCSTYFGITKEDVIWVNFSYDVFLMVKDELCDMDDRFYGVEPVTWRKLFDRVMAAYKNPTPENLRQVLVYFGTNVVRNEVCGGYWVDELCGVLKYMTAQGGIDKVYIADWRFPNEDLTKFGSVAHLGIHRVRVNTPLDVRIQRLGYDASGAPSEQFIDQLEVDEEVSGNE